MRLVPTCLLWQHACRPFTLKYVMSHIWQNETGTGTATRSTFCVSGILFWAFWCLMLVYMHNDMKLQMLRLFGLMKLVLDSFRQNPFSEISCFAIPCWELWGSVLEAWTRRKDRFWGSWAHFGLHFWWLLRVLRLPGTLQGPLCAPRAAWIDFWSDFGSQMGGQGSPNASQNRSKNLWNFECIFWWNFDRKMEAKMSPNASQDDAKMHKKIM